MSEFYTDGVKQFLRSVEWPRGLVVNVIEYDTHLALRLYRLNFEQFSAIDKLKISERVGEAINGVRNSGCPCYLEVVKGDGAQHQ
jgi:hypothetical protein